MAPEQFAEPCRTLFFDCNKRFGMSYAQSAALMRAFDCDADEVLVHILSWKKEEDIKLPCLVAKRKYLSVALEHVDALKRLRLVFAIWPWIMQFDTARHPLRSIIMKSATRLDLRVAIKVNPYILMHHDVSMDACAALAKRNELEISDAQLRYAVALDLLFKRRGVASFVGKADLRGAISAAGLEWAEDFLENPYDDAFMKHPLYEEGDEDNEPFALTLSELRCRAPKINIFDKYEYMRLYANVIAADGLYWLRESYHAEQGMISFVASRIVKSKRDPEEREALCVKRTKKADPVFDF